MQRVRRVGPAALLTSCLLLVGGCSEGAPDASAPGSTVASAAAPGTAASTPAAALTPTPSSSASSASSASPASPASPASTAAPAPSPSGSARVEPTRPVRTAPPTKLEEPARTAGAKVSLTSVRATDITAASPGDQSGPGVLVRLQLVNTTGHAIDLSFVSVSIQAASGRPAASVDGPPTRALAGSLRPGARATGTYAFVLADATSTPVTVAVYVTSGQPVVTFRGRAR